MRLAPDATLLQPVLARSLALAGHKDEAREVLEAAVLGTKTSAEIMDTAEQKANEIIGKHDK